MARSRAIWSPLSKQTPATVKRYGLDDYLQADSRPTFLIDLSALDDRDQIVDASLAFYNTALSVNTALRDNITRVVARILSEDEKDGDDGEAIDFLSWLSGGSQNSIWFCDTLWSATDIDAKWRIVSGVCVSPLISCSNCATSCVHCRQSSVSRMPTETRATYGQSTRPTCENLQVARDGPGIQESRHSEILLSSVAKPSSNQQLMQSYDWASTELGPIATWPRALYQVVKQVLASPMPEFVYWGPSRNTIWNEAGSKNLRGFDEATPGFSAFHVYSSFWNQLCEPLCQEVERTGLAVAPSKSPGPLIERDGGLRETFWTSYLMPILDDDGDVRGIRAVVHDTTTEVLVEGRIDTLLKVNEAIGTAKDLSSFWAVVIAELKNNAADIPLAAVYSIGNDAMIDSFTDLETQHGWQTSSNVNSQNGTSPIRRWVLEGSIGFPDGHVCIPSEMEFYDTRGLSAEFRRAMGAPKMGDVLLCTENGTIPAELLVGCEDRGLNFECTQLIICPLQRPSGGVIAWLVLGINPRRSFDDEYKRFTQLLSRHVESKLVFVLTLEREKKIARQSAEEAAHKQRQLSLQLQQRIREAEQSQARFFNFAKQAPTGVFILGSEGEVKFCNDAWYKTFDLVPGTALPKAWLARTHPDDISLLNHVWEQLVKGFVHNKFEWRVLRPGSTSFDSEDDIMYLESCGFPEMGEDGTLQSVTGLTTDVSLDKAYRREQAEKLKTALEAKRTQEYFMDMVSHEMRNPLNAIIQCTEEASQSIEKLKDGTGAWSETNAVLDDVRDMINTILYCGTHQKQLINDVLTLSKLDSNLLVVHPVEVYPAALLHQAIKVYSSEIRASGISVFINSDGAADDGEDSAIMADPSRILQILINLISNANKFMKGREKCELHMKVHTSRKQQYDGVMHYFSSGNNRPDPTSEAEWGTGEPVYVYFSVRDTGPGLSEVEMSSLFTRFQQASPRTHVTYGGSGLGLFISRELAELHGGEIGMTSQVDHGSTFVFYIKGRRLASHSGIAKPDQPSHQSLQQGGKATVVDRTAPGLKSLSRSTTPSQPISPLEMHVLVVEDNEVNQRVLKRQLQKLGCQVTTANHGGEALNIIQTSTWWQGDPIQAKGTRPSDSNDARPRLSIVLCDLEMPIMDGATFVRQVRQWQKEGLLYAKIPVVAVTGNARAEQTMLAAGSDFDDVVSKPYSLMSMVGQMVALVDQPVAVPT